jgi:hypothetical protein
MLKRFFGERRSDDDRHNATAQRLGQVVLTDPGDISDMEPYPARTPEEQARLAEWAREAHISRLVFDTIEAWNGKCPEI